MSSKLNKILLSKKHKYSVINISSSQPENDILKKVADLINDNVDIIELDGKNIYSGLFYNIAVKVREITAVFDVLLVITDRIDIAKLIGADGICLDENSVAANIAKRLTEDEIFIGYKTDKNPDENILSYIDYIATEHPHKNSTIKTFRICN